MFPVNRICKTADHVMHRSRHCSALYFGVSDEFCSHFADFARVSGGCFDTLALFRRKCGSVCEVTYRWSLTWDKCSAFSRKQNFCQMTVNCVLFCVNNRFCFYWSILWFCLQFCDRKNHRALVPMINLLKRLKWTIFLQQVDKIFMAPEKNWG